ncbi:MAG: hypothetical protein LBU23_07115 [Planctomycetota bacterium]|nr:hypothetical protein [Planctomycetota bacterium]
MLAALQAAAEGKLAERLEAILFSLADAKADPRFPAWLTALLRYFVSLNQPERGKEAVNKVLNNFVDKEAAEMLATSLAQEWLLEGRAEGEAKGIAKGKAEGIILVLKSRFGSLPTNIQNKVRGCSDIDRLDSWITLAAVCQSLYEFKKGLR